MTHVSTSFARGLGATVDPPAERLSSFIERGRRVFPEITLSDERVAFELGVRARGCAGGDLDAWFEALEIEDLFLAIACGAGDDASYAIVEALYGRELRALLRRYESGRLTAADLYQSLFERVFVATDTHRARILDYSGAGLLKNWMRVTAVRMAIDQSRRAKREQVEVLGFEADGLIEAAQDSMDLELDFLKVKYRADFKVALERGLGRLEPVERNMLRQHLIGGLSIDQLGVLHSVHRATAARRLASARERLLEETRAELMELLSIARGEFDSIMRLISSNLDVSFVRMLGSTHEVT